jgi:hypothetical protein
MGPFMDTAMLIEAVMLSFLFALWVAWLGLRGLFRLLPGASLGAVPVRAIARGATSLANRNVARAQ